MSVFVVGQTPDDMVQGQATMESTSVTYDVTEFQILV